MRLQYEERVPCRYDTEKDLSDRLHGTVCKYKGVPFLVNILGGTTLSLSCPVIEYDSKGAQKKNKEDSIVIKSTDEDFSIESIELGYFNFSFEGVEGHWSPIPNTAVYGYRLNGKQYRQGIAKSNTGFVAIDGKPAPMVNGSGYFYSRGFYDSLQEKFPSLEEAKALLELKVNSVAISQEIALQKLSVGITMVYIRTKSVGYISSEGNKVIFNNTDSGNWIYKSILDRHSIPY